MGFYRPRINNRLVTRPTANHPNQKHWDQLRLAALERDGHACRCCPNHAMSGVQLEIHHRHYANWGHEELDDVVTLCVICHDAITSRIRETTEYNIKPPERVARPERPTVTTPDVTVQGEVHKVLRPDRPSVALSPVEVQPVTGTGIPPRDKPRG